MNEIFQEAYGKVQELLTNNDFLQGGVILAMLTASWMYLRSIPLRLWDTFLYYSSISVELQDHCPSFAWLASYSTDEFKARNSGPFFLLGSKDKYRSDNLLFPSGVRWTRKGFCLMRFSLSKRELENNNSNKAVEYSLHITLFGLGKKKVLDKILEESEKKYGPKTRELEVVRPSWGNFETLSTLVVREKDSIYSEKLQDIIDQVDDFCNSEEGYRKRGIPYRLGVLLYGPPGTGKSSIAKFLAGHVRRDLVVVNPRSSNELRDAFSSSGSLILIEDVDCAGASVGNRENKEVEVAESGMGATLADLLNSMDGVSTGDNLIYIMTTNHKDKLDPALIRPGRVDLSVELTYLSQKEFEMACENLYGEKPTKEITKNVTPAKLQEVYLKNKTDFPSFLETCCKEMMTDD